VFEGEDMSFAMIHLAVANKLFEKTNRIEKEADFYLGSIAPDFIHIRENYKSEMKKRSHLCVGEQAWGRITNNEAWTENALAFLDENIIADNRDFLYGYAVHVLTDIENNKKIWMPFYGENKELLQQGVASQYHSESADIDLELFHRFADRPYIWEQLARAKAFDVGQVITACEIEEMREVFLVERYQNRFRGDITKNEYETLTGTEQFIETASEGIREILYPEA
jgi:hypothetical protein